MNYLNKNTIGYGIAILGLAGFIFALTLSNEKGPDLGVKSASASEIHAKCEATDQGSEITNCYRENFQSYMEANGGRKTLLLLDELDKLGGYAHTNCHPLSHIVGNVALHVYGTVPKAAPEYLPVCHSGYYHGLLEEFLATATSYEEGIATVCGSPTEQVYFNWFQCTHGMGHGIMQFKDNEVPQSLKDCDILDPASSAREICYAGVFMENITTDEKTGHPAKYIKKDDPIYPCNAVEEKYKSACYFLVSSQILKINGWNFENAFAVCANDAEEPYRWLCYQSMGRDVAGSTQRDHQKSKDLCLLAKSTEAREHCYFGAVRDYINEKGEFDRAIEFCNFIDQPYKQTCHNGIFTDLSIYRRGDAFRSECAKMTEPFRAQCQVRVVS